MYYIACYIKNKFKTRKKQNTYCKYDIEAREEHKRICLFALKINFV